MSVQRPFTPLCRKTSAPASQKARPRGTLFVAFFFIQSNEQYSTISSQRDSSISISRKLAICRIWPSMSCFRSEKCISIYRCCSPS